MAMRSLRLGFKAAGVAGGVWPRRARWRARTFWSSSWKRCGAWVFCSAWTRKRASGRPIRPAGGEGERDRRQRPRSQHVVGVEPGQDLAGRPGEALVDGVGLALVPSALGMGEAGAVALEDGGGLVARASVHDDMLDI